MMGCHAGGQDKLFYSFNLEDHVPKNHLLRGIDCFLELIGLRQHLSQFYSHTGRPSIDPELMIRMLVIGYSLGIRSERSLCEEVHLNLAYRWFCCLCLEDQVPDHSTFSKNRHGRFRESDAFCHLFETVLQRCMKEGLVRGEGFATDASIIKADAQRQRGIPGDEATDWGNPDEATRPIRGYLARLKKLILMTTHRRRFRSLTRYPPGLPHVFAYCTNYLIDLDAGIIVDVEASAVNKAAEVNATRIMIDRVEERYDIKPTWLVGDTNYGSGPMLDWMINDKGIAPHVPVNDKSERNDGTLSRSDFQWDEVANEYRCPEGQALRSNWRPFNKPRLHITKADTILYRSSQKNCSNCPMKPQCCQNWPVRKVSRSIYEPARDVARAIGETDAKQSRREHKKG